ncbi:MAG: hypothetical protein ABWK01_01390 [Infirmifilum sp.]
MSLSSEGGEELRLKAHLYPPARAFELEVPSDVSRLQVYVYADKGSLYAVATGCKPVKALRPGGLVVETAGYYSCERIKLGSRATLEIAGTPPLNLALRRETRTAIRRYTKRLARAT